MAKEWARFLLCLSLVCAVINMEIVSFVESRSYFRLFWIHVSESEAGGLNEAMTFTVDGKYFGLFTPND